MSCLCLCILFCLTMSKRRRSELSGTWNDQLIVFNLSSRSAPRSGKPARLAILLICHRYPDTGALSIGSLGPAKVLKQFVVASSVRRVRRLPCEQQRPLILTCVL
ncbi:hypothetical protein CPB84DRAFT_1758699 [Gymnopilus junonius]|uniref:Secreted protein n=1 Tax=Gymnopilus junonius TaxID=109634 RepID=A0A9P5TUH7_GYMJU|nr:hypothetical protein CPB84DRAFT_1758699 [Gymnopilus junonius]